MNVPRLARPIPGRQRCPPARSGWTVLLHRNSHVHTFVSGTGSSGASCAEDHGDIGTFAYEVILTATDEHRAEVEHQRHPAGRRRHVPPATPANLTATASPRATSTSAWTRRRTTPWSSLPRRALPRCRLLEFRGDQLPRDRPHLTVRWPWHRPPSTATGFAPRTTPATRASATWTRDRASGATAARRARRRLLVRRGTGATVTACPATPTPARSTAPPGPTAVSVAGSRSTATAPCACRVQRR